MKPLSVTQENPAVAPSASASELPMNPRVFSNSSSSWSSWSSWSSSWSSWSSSWWPSSSRWCSTNSSSSSTENSSIAKPLISTLSFSRLKASKWKAKFPDEASKLITVLSSSFTEFRVCWIENCVSSTNCSGIRLSMTFTTPPIAPLP